MYKSQPNSNRILAKKEEERIQALHLQRLREIKSSQSKTLKLQRSNSELLQSCAKLRNTDLKKLAMKKVIGSEVERENRSLLERIAIVTRSSHRDMNLTPIPVKLKSLNQVARKADIVKITQENQEIYKRIQAQRSNYSSKDWEKHSKMMDYYFSQLCEYPPVLSQSQTAHDFHKTNLLKSRSQSSMKKFRVTGRVQDTPDESWHERKLSETDAAKENVFPSRSQSSQYQRGHWREISDKNENRGKSSQQQTKIFKKNMQIGNSSYNVDISFSDMHFNILADDVETLDLKFIKISKEEGKKMLAHYNYSYEALAQDLYIENGQLKHKYLETNKTLAKSSSDANLQGKSAEKGLEKSAQKLPPLELEKKAQKEQNTARSAEEGESQKEGAEQSKENKENKQTDLKSSSRRLSQEKSQSKPATHREERASVGDDASGFNTGRSGEKILLDLVLDRPSAANSTKSVQQKKMQRGPTPDEPRSLANSGLHEKNKKDAQNSGQKRHSVADTNFNSRHVLNTNHSKDLSHSAHSKRLSAVITVTTAFQPKSKNETHQETSKDSSPRINEAKNDHDDKAAKGQSPSNEKPDETEKNEKIAAVEGDNAVNNEEDTKNREDANNGEENSVHN